MNYWRISKYNPALRDQHGFYHESDWTSSSDIGKIFNGNQLTYAAYMQVEDAYVHSINSFLYDTGISSLQVVSFEAKAPVTSGSILRQYQLDQLLDTSIVFFDKELIDSSDLEDACRLNLRELIWCKLEQSGTFYVHFGYDYYMYIGSHATCTAAIQATQAAGLYVEPMVSPYLTWH